MLLSNLQVLLCGEERWGGCECKGATGTAVLVLTVGSAGQQSHLMQVCLHELKDHINVFEVTGARREHDVFDLHNVCSSQ